MRGSWTSWICWLINSPGISQRVELSRPILLCLERKPYYYQPHPFPRIKRTTSSPLLLGKSHGQFFSRFPQHPRCGREGFELWWIAWHFHIIIEMQILPSRNEGGGQCDPFSCRLSTVLAFPTLAGVLVLWRVSTTCTHRSWPVFTVFMTCTYRSWPMFTISTTCTHRSWPVFTAHSTPSQEVLALTLEGKDGLPAMSCSSGSLLKGRSSFQAILPGPASEPTGYIDHCRER